MGDRTYVWFAVPVHALATVVARDAVSRIFGIPGHQLDATLGAEPDPEESGFIDDIRLRLVDGAPCLVVEDCEMNYGGSAIEEALQAAGIPYLQANDTACEYGPSRAAWCAGEHATIRSDHLGDPITGLRIIDGRACVDDSELADFEAYTRLRAQVLGTTSSVR